MIKHSIFTIGIALLLAGCADSHTDPESFGDETGDSTSTGSDSDTSGSETDSGSSSSGDTGSTGDGDGDTDGTDTGDTDGTGETGEPSENPGPDEPCDPLLAFEGIAPCEDPENPLIEYTCGAVPLMPNPNETVWEFRCQRLKDVAQDGNGLGDGCFDDNSYVTGYSGCQDAWCLSNGHLEGNGHINWPDDECGFGGGNDPIVRGCCSPFCDAENPCGGSYFCRPLTVYLPSLEAEYSGLGTCVWAG